MSFISDIGDAFSDAAKFVGNAAETVVNTVGDVADVAVNVADRMIDGAIDSAKGTFDSFENFAKAVAFATVLAPVSMGVTVYNLGEAIYEETDKKLSQG